RSDGAAHARAAETAVSARVLREILLVIRLGVVELGRGGDLGRDRVEAALPERRLVAVARRLSGAALLVVVPVDRGAVLRADVVALTHALRRIVRFPENPEQAAGRDLFT